MKSGWYKRVSQKNNDSEICIGKFPHYKTFGVVFSLCFEALCFGKLVRSFRKSIVIQGI